MNTLRPLRLSTPIITSLTHQTRQLQLQLQLHSHYAKPFTSTPSNFTTSRSCTPFLPINSNYQTYIQHGYAQQPLLHHLGVQLREVSPGYCSFTLPYSDKLTQHHGYYHGGAIASVVDVAGGFAAGTLVPANAAPLTVEMKINFVTAAKGEKGSALVAKGRVIKNGKTLKITKIDVYWRGKGEWEGGNDEGEEDESALCATAIQTIFVKPNNTK